MSRTQNNTHILRSDLFGVTMVLFIALVAILAQIEEAEESPAEIEAPGAVMASISWPAGDTDVDLWMTGPGEPLPIGYSNKGGVLWNLLRDDLGLMPDATPLNYENAFTRGMPPGEYRINVHCFRCNKLPLEVSLEASMRASFDGSAGMKTIATSTITMHKNGEEKTAIVFEIDDAGQVVPDSLNTVFKPLRAAIYSPTEK